jgi:DNA-binding transcriptional LysR family regulator
MPIVQCKCLDITVIDNHGPVSSDADIRTSGGSAQFQQGCKSAHSVTTAVQSLEKLFGVRLLVRTTRQLTLTHAGAAYYERCRSILADIEQTEAQLFGVAAEPKAGCACDSTSSAREEFLRDWPL